MEVLTMLRSLQNEGASEHIRYHFIRSLENEGVVSLNYCNTSEQIADVFTKGLTIQKHENFRSLLGLRCFGARECVDNAQKHLRQSPG